MENMENKVIPLEKKEHLRELIAEKNFLIKKLTEFKTPLEKYRQLVGNKQAERLLLKIGRVVEEINKVKPSEIAKGNHLSHILGQFQARTGWIERLEKVSRLGDQTKIQKCREMLDEVVPAFSAFLDSILASREYLLGEVGSEEGYFGKEEIGGKRKIHSLDACEFSLFSWDSLSKEDKEAIAKEAVA